MLSQSDDVTLAGSKLQTSAACDQLTPVWLLRAGVGLLAVSSLAIAGCAWSRSRGQLTDSSRHYAETASHISYPEATADTAAVPRDVLSTPRPVSINDGELPQFRDLTLEEVIQTGLANSTVLRDLGGAILSTPDMAATRLSPGITETDPRFGVQAALSDFDAQFSTRATFENNDRALNNVFFGGGTRLFNQDLNVYQTQIRKQSATGSTFAFRKNIEYDANNAPGNTFPSAWNVNLEAEVRHPLLRGAGVQFNRIAGPNGIPGLYGGVLLARVNTEIEATEFEASIRDFVSNLENSYWDLYFAYRDLQSKIDARNGALRVLHTVQAQLGRAGFDAEREAEAREQYYRFQQEVENALNGRLVDGTRTGNGSTGGTFRGSGGVYVSERRMRRLMGIPITDGTLIRPVDEPTMAAILFDWQQSVAESISRRPELQRQRRLLHRRELELTATQNFLLPSLDVVGQYRWRGFGDDLLATDRNDMRFDNAFQNLTSGDFKEWQLGVEMNFPFGFRRAHNAVEYYELLVARERAVLREQEEQIVHDLSNAVAEKDRAYRVAQTGYDRRRAAKQHVIAVEARFDAGKATADEVLDAQRRLADAESAFFLALAEYMLAIKNVHFEKGSLLDYNSIYLTENLTPELIPIDRPDLVPLEPQPAETDVPYEQSRPLPVPAPIEDQPAEALPRPLEPAPPAEPAPLPLPAPLDGPGLSQMRTESRPSPRPDGAILQVGHTLDGPGRHSMNFERSTSDSGAELTDSKSPSSLESRLSQPSHPRPRPGQTDARPTASSMRGRNLAVEDAWVSQDDVP